MSKVQAELTEEILREVILKYDAASKTRKDLVLSYRLLCKVAGINADFSDIKCAYSRKELKPRDLPTDEQILDWYYRIKNPNWRFVYGLIATFGLRPHECFTCNLLDYHANPEQTYLEITESKTGYHTAFPFMPEWVELFCLKQGTLPKITAKSNVEFGRKVLHYLKGDARLPFAVYDLRHAWSVRTMILGLPVDVAASMMGHSVAIHTRTYQQWIKQSHQQKAFEDTLTKMQVLSNLSLPSSFNR